MSTSTENSSLALVNLMCARVEPAISDYRQTVLEPGCGTGNFLVAILKRRLVWLLASAPKRLTATTQMQLLTALSTLYGIDNQPINVAITRERLQKTLREVLVTHTVDYRFWPLAEMILNNNILVADLLRDIKTIKLPVWSAPKDFCLRMHEECLHD